MDSPSKDLERFRQKLAEAQRLLDSSDWEAAGKILNEALAVDDRQAKPYALLAVVHAELGDAAQAEIYREKAKAIREEKWKREVEAEARGHHELLGEAARHEIP